jgi:hypothetical protein
MVCVSPNQFDGAHKRPLALRHELRTMVQSPAHVGATPACDRLPSRFIGSQKCNPCAWELLLPMSVEHTMSSPSPGGEGRGEGESTTINPLRVSMSRSSGKESGAVRNCGTLRNFGLGPRPSTTVLTQPQPPQPVPSFSSEKGLSS